MVNNKIKEASKWYLNVAGLSPKDMNYYIENKVVTTVKLKELSSYCYSLKHKKVKWNDIFISLKDIKDAIKNNVEQSSKCFNEMQGKMSDDYHIKRVIYFINHPGEITDIVLFENVSNFDIIDGSHRLMAALYLDLEEVKVISIGVNEKIHLINLGF